MIENAVETVMRQSWMQLAVQFATHSENIRDRQRTLEANRNDLAAKYAEGMADYAEGMAQMYRDLAAGNRPAEQHLRVVH